MLRILLALLILTTEAMAGPWPMKAGEGHLSLAFEGSARDGHDFYATLYAEIGIGTGRTLGLDAGQSADRLDKAVLFLRNPFGPRDRQTVYAFEIGAGTVDGKAALRPGISVGRGFSLRGRPAWLAVDMRAAVYDGGRAGVLETDVTLGAETAGGNKWMVQLQMAAPSNRSAYAKLAPSYAFRRGNDRHLVIGATAGLANASDAKLTFGLWQAF